LATIVMRVWVGLASEPSHRRSVDSPAGAGVRQDVEVLGVDQQATMSLEVWNRSASCDV
jgi:hypothetical protein